MCNILPFLAVTLAILYGANAQCKDTSSYCASWKQLGYCKGIYAAYMKKNCKDTCGFCSPATIPPPPAPTADPYPNCRDKSTYCPSYRPYCKSATYIKYLKKECKKTCNYCHVTTQPPPTTKPWTTQLYTVPGGYKSLQPGCGKKGPSHTRIVGGVMAKPGDWPWMVNFDYEDNVVNPGHSCGGTLITDEWILSAAHCFNDDLNKTKYWLKLGEHDIKTESGHEQRIPIADILIHPKYDPTTYNNDLALVKLSRKATINDRVKTACLPDHNTTFANGTICFLTGWGLLSSGGRGPKILRQAQVPLVDHQTCKKSNPHHLVSDKMLCAGYAEGGIDSCQGDSGGPLVCKTQDDTWFLWGAVSWGVGCGAANSYGFYANTKTLRPWVDSVVFKRS